METAKILRKVKNICKKYRTCTDCPFEGVICGTTPEYWSDPEIENMTKIIDSCKEEEK